MTRIIGYVGYVSTALWMIGASAIAADLSTVPKQLAFGINSIKIPIGFAFYSQYASDYNFRGVSISNRQGSQQNFFELQFLDNAAYAGIYTWQTRLPTRPSFKLDTVAGIRPTFGKLTLDFGVAYYNFLNEIRLINPVDGSILSTANSDFIEYSGKALYQVDDSVTIGSSIFHAPNYFGQHNDATFVSGNMVASLPSEWFPWLPEAYSKGFSSLPKGALLPRRRENVGHALQPGDRSVQCRGHSKL